MREGSTGGLAEQRDLRIAGDKTNFYARKIFLPSTDSASNTNRTNVIGLRNEQNYDSSSARICDNMFWRCFDNSLYNHGLYFQRKTALRESEHLNIFTCTTNGLHYNCNRFPAYAQSHVVFGLQEWIAHLESSDSATDHRTSIRRAEIQHGHGSICRGGLRVATERTFCLTFL